MQEKPVSVPYPIWIFVFLVSLVAIFACKTISKAGPSAEYRDYKNAKEHVKTFYRLQHKYQTYEFASHQREQVEMIMSLVKKADAHLLSQLEQQGFIKRLSIWDAINELDKVIDESDPDFSLPNSVHAFQTAEAIRKDLPRLALAYGVAPESLDWFIMAGLLHDIGKIDASLRKVPQWAVVGDSFPVGCKFSEANIFYDYFRDNPDHKDERYNSTLGIYKPGLGLDNIIMSFGHDEYAYQVLKDQSILPKEALSMLRFHSFYPLHHEHAYEYLLAEADKEQVLWVKAFSPYDLYSKHEEQLSVRELKDFYKKLINKYFPPEADETERLVAWPILRPVE